MTIAELQRALVEVSEICRGRTYCGGCPFDRESSNFCPIMDRPDEWFVDDWKENSDG